MSKGRVGRGLDLFARYVVEPLDFVVTVLILLVGLSAVIYLAIAGGSAIQVAILLVLMLFVALKWHYTSFSSEWVRDRLRARKENPPE